MIASATPAVPIVFKGREELVEQGVAIFCQQCLRFLAILGAGGMGKTSLALHIMDSDLVQNKFGERCYFIPCELFEDAESLVQGLIHVMELTMQESQSKQKVLFNHLQSAHGDLLIVFDNFETPWNHGNSRIGVKNLLEKIAKCGKVSLIVTMRGPDGPGDIAWERLGDQSGIPTLLPVPAKEAFKAFSGNKLQSSDDSESQIDSLLYQLEYVPLAIRLSAQHVKRVPLRTLIRMWEKDKTSIVAEQTEPGRLTSVSFSIDLSIQIFRIEGRTLELLSTISFLPDGIPLWVESLDLMFPGEGLSVNVSTLVESSLIYDRNEGLKMLAPVREHVHSKYPIEQVNIDQLEMFYAQFLENLPDNNMTAQSELQLHINNIEKIFKAQINSGHPKTSSISAVKEFTGFSRFNSVSMGLIDLILEKDTNIKKNDEVDLKLMRAFRWQWMGSFHDAEAQVMSVKDCINEEGNISQSEADILGRCFDLLQYIYYSQTQYEKAINMSLQAQKYFKKSENQWAQADSMRWLGDVYYMQDRYKEASETISEAQQLFQKIGNELGVAECLRRLGDIYRMQGRNDEAIKMLSDALKQFQTFGNQAQAAECLLSLGELYRKQQKYNEATEMIMKAQKQFEEIRDKKGVADCLQTLGFIYGDQAHYDEAVGMCSNAQMQYQNIGSVVDVAWCFHIMQDIYYTQAQYEKAINMSLQAQKYFKKSENQWAQANSMSWLGDIYYMQTRYKEASEIISEAQQLFYQIGNELGVAECLKRLGDIHRMQGRNDEAIKMISDASKQFQTFGNQMQAAECLWSLGELYRKQKKYDEATEMIMKAQKQFEEIGYKRGVADCWLILGYIYRNQAQYNEAVGMFSNSQREYENIGRIVDVAVCYQYLGITHRLQDQHEQGKEAFTKALELLREFPGEKYTIGWTLLEFGYLFFDMKDFVEARRKYEEARDIFASHGQLARQVDECSRALAKLDEAMKQ
ncbi:TPR-like protein [Dendrothele bispora CBS 962.96]|uniref:TPR-like protein n=1 Tax=Dendrothele bispora (strain CBS 962.96) TaxID=1314807 RepID=A0A4S8KQ87_DENBC|nr:TPR-like protein [Dendrothele bispora CBS 962.96]